MRRPFALVCVAVFTVACSKSNEAEKIPLGAAPATQAAAMSDVVSGTLLEQIPASPYVYLRLKTANGDVWAAVNQTQLTIGAHVTVNNAILMEKFESKTLNRTFDQIYFGSLDAPGSAPSGMAGNAAAPTSVGTPQAVDAQVGKVEKASGANARTIGELWAQQAGLSDKTVSIRGVVVKYNPGVMGKNWIHLQDGSGDAAKGTHDITVTSMDAAAPGATVTITGTVRLNRDFGAGYTYALIVEDAKVVVK
ncbi:MAG: nucleotide-binding protein [Gemmatimonadaceae bacterium]|nr:nucleotide-binding protein [Gemmatimonadaceae bacterium]